MLGGVRALLGVDAAATGGPDADTTGVAVMGAVREKKNAFK